MARLAFEFLGKAEVGDLGRAVTTHQDIGRLEIAVDNPFGVGGIDSPGETFDQLNCIPRGLGRAVDHDVERCSVNELERQKRKPVALAEIVDLDDIRVLERGHGPGLGLKPHQLLRRGVIAGQDHLHGHEAIEGLLPSFVDNSRCAAAQLVEQFVTSDGW